MKYTTETFIIKAKEIHGDKYDYSLVEYINSQIKVKIICHIHGVFEQTPASHIFGCGCKKCNQTKSGKKTLTKEIFVKRARIKHGNKFDYSLVEYINTNSKVKIICPVHGVFEQTPKEHLKYNGCRYCSNKYKKNKEIFTKEAKEIFGNKYDYSKVKYVNNKTKVILICKKHGEFSITPSNHIFFERDCPKCKCSKGENKIEKYLIENNIKFENQKTFEGCILQSKLRFDFYLPDYNTCIEYDGKQHYQSIKLFGGEESYKLTQLRDKIKNKFCIDNDIKLIRIRYNDNYIEKLNKTFNY
jgi:hypothetical protein